MAKKSKSKSKAADLGSISSFDKETGTVQVVIETPQGSRIKYKHDEKLKCFTVSSVLPEGMVFPFDFGFVPSTKSQDGDPIDVLLLMDAPAFPGTVARCRLIGVIEAQQTESDGTSERNDRLIAVAESSRRYQEVKSISDLDHAIMAEIEHFFINYNRESGKRFKPQATKGPNTAMKLLKKAEK